LGRLILTYVALLQDLRVAVVSDIHGNLIALRTVVADIRTRKADRVVCLGDVATVGPQPREVIATLRRLGWPCVKGNTDEDLALGIPEGFEPDMPERERKMNEELDAWTRAQLTEADRSFLSNFKRTLLLRLPGSQTIVCYHGSPESNRIGITVNMTEDKVVLELGYHEGTVFAGGHTHFQMLRSVKDKLVINPGSVGFPFERGNSEKLNHPCRVEYAMVESDGKSLGVKLLRVPYRLDELERTIQNSGLPNPRWWMSSWREARSEKRPDLRP